MDCIVLPFPRSMKYFTIEEMERSTVAQFQALDNTMPTLVRLSAIEFIEKVLDPLRGKFGAPIYVTSGYRCPQLNRLVGGSVTSQHLLGTAADITALNKKDNKRIWKLLQLHTVDFDQAILYGDYAFIHVGWKKSGNQRHQMMEYPYLGGGYKQD